MFPPRCSPSCHDCPYRKCEKEMRLGRISFCFAPAAHSPLQGCALYTLSPACGRGCTKGGDLLQSRCGETPSPQCLRGRTPKGSDSLSAKENHSLWKPTRERLLPASVGLSKAVTSTARKCAQQNDLLQRRFPLPLVRHSRKPPDDHRRAAEFSFYPLSPCRRLPKKLRKILHPRRQSGSG